jgi:hypothetical protein
VYIRHSNFDFSSRRDWAVVIPKSFTGSPCFFLHFTSRKIRTCQQTDLHRHRSTTLHSFETLSPLLAGKVKVKLSLYLTNQALRHEDAWGSGCIDPHYLDRGTSWRSVVSCTPRPLEPQGKSPGTNWIGGWVDPRAGLDDMEKRNFLTLPGLELRHLGRPARSQSLYRLRHLGSTVAGSRIKM